MFFFRASHDPYIFLTSSHSFLGIDVKRERNTTTRLLKCLLFFPPFLSSFRRTDSCYTSESARVADYCSLRYTVKKLMMLLPSSSSCVKIRIS